MPSGRRCRASPVLAAPPTKPARRVATLLSKCAKRAFASEPTAASTRPDPARPTAGLPKSQTASDSEQRLHGQPPRQRSFDFLHYKDSQESREWRKRVEESPQALAPGYEAQKKHGWMHRKGEAGLRGDMPARPSSGHLCSLAQRRGSLLRPPYGSVRRGNYVPPRHRPRLAVCCRPRSRVATPAWTPSSFSVFRLLRKRCASLQRRWGCACACGARMTDCAQKYSYPQFRYRLLCLSARSENATRSVDAPRRPGAGSDHRLVLVTVVVNYN